MTSTPSGRIFFGRRGFLEKISLSEVHDLCDVFLRPEAWRIFLRVDVGHQRRLSVKVLGGAQLLRRYGFATVHGEIGGTFFKVSFYYNEGIKNSVDIIGFE